MNSVGKIIVVTGGVLMVGGLTFSALGSSIILKNKQALNSNVIEWNEAAREYVIKTGGASRSIPEDQVLQMNIDKPADYDKAKALIASRQYAQALPLLADLIRKYKKLVWDVESLKLQAQCYVEMNEPKKATSSLDALFAAGATLTPALQKTYWTALQKAGDTERLQKDLVRTLGTGAPDLVAAAYLIRGNAYLQDGNQEAALADYIKVVTIFKNEKEPQPEALYQAAILLEKAQDPRATEFRKILANDYKNSEFAAKLQPAAK